MCEQLKKDVLCLSQTHSQQNPHLSSQHLHAGRDPSGRVSQEGWSKHQAQDIWHQAQEPHFHSGDGGEWWVQQVTLQGPTLPGQANVGPRCNHSFTMGMLEAGMLRLKTGMFHLPSAGWAGWDPSVEALEVKSKAVFVCAWNLPNCALSNHVSFLVSSAWAFSGLHINLKIYQAEMGGIGWFPSISDPSFQPFLQVWI